MLFPKNTWLYFIFIILFCSATVYSSACDDSFQKAVGLDKNCLTGECKTQVYLLSNNCFSVCQQEFNKESIQNAFGCYEIGRSSLQPIVINSDQVSLILNSNRYQILYLFDKNMLSYLKSIAISNDLGPVVFDKNELAGRYATYSGFAGHDSLYLIYDQLCKSTTQKECLGKLGSTPVSFYDKNMATYLGLSKESINYYADSSDSVSVKSGLLFYLSLTKLYALSKVSNPVAQISFVFDLIISIMAKIWLDVLLIAFGILVIRILIYFGSMKYIWLRKTENWIRHSEFEESQNEKVFSFGKVPHETILQLIITIWIGATIWFSTLPAFENNVIQALSGGNIDAILFIVNYSEMWTTILFIQFFQLAWILLSIAVILAISWYILEKKLGQDVTKKFLWSIQIMMIVTFSMFILYLVGALLIIEKVFVGLAFGFVLAFIIGSVISGIIVDMFVANFSGKVETINSMSKSFKINKKRKWEY
jgi:hypothetical protein